MLQEVLKIVAYKYSASHLITYCLIANRLQNAENHFIAMNTRLTAYWFTEEFHYLNANMQNVAD